MLDGAKIICLHCKNIYRVYFWWHLIVKNQAPTRRLALIRLLTVLELRFDTLLWLSSVFSAIFGRGSCWQLRLVPPACACAALFARSTNSYAFFAVSCSCAAFLWVLLILWSPAASGATRGTLQFTTSFNTHMAIFVRYSECRWFFIW